jgi:hypothetical protein
MKAKSQLTASEERLADASGWLRHSLVAAVAAASFAVQGANGGDSLLEMPGAFDAALGAAESSEQPFAPLDAFYDETLFDEQLQPAQAVGSSPAARSGVRPTTPITTPRLGARSTARTSALVGLASIPYMIGDTGAGTCIGLQGIVNAELNHPTLACARLNIAEANTALPVDRLYYSYRHFHNASTVSAYQFHRDLDYDRHLIAWERTFWDQSASVELRLPIEQHITSPVFTTLVPSAGIVELLDATQPSKVTEIGNVSGIFKYLLWESDTTALSGGLGVTLPTARDVDYFLNVDGIVSYPDNPGLTADVQSVTVARFANETVYLEPFLAWLVHPPGPWYHMGFFQVETAANPTRVTFFGNGAAQFFQNGAPVGTYVYQSDFPGRLELFSQTLMRLNLGLGRLLVDRPAAPWLRHVTGLAELHYTTTLNDANLTEVPLTTLGTIGSPTLQTITIGNGMNRVDILNAAAGVSMDLAGWTITHGAIVPIREERGFDFEYNLQVQRPF